MANVYSLTVLLLLSIWIGSCAGYSKKSEAQSQVDSGTKQVSKSEPVLWEKKRLLEVAKCVGENGWPVLLGIGSRVCPEENSHSIRKALKDADRYAVERTAKFSNDVKTKNEAVEHLNQLVHTYGSQMPRPSTDCFNKLLYVIGYALIKTASIFG
jgi:hypothetical protein